MSVGDRVVYGEKRGTIRFIGEVPPFAGTWFGIDWDCPDDGKHDGTYKGVRYFSATYPKSGSFVKSTDVNFGCKFVDALREQYDYDVVKAREEYEKSMKEFDVSVFDFVNLEKVKLLQGPLNSLQVVNLAAYNISSPGDPGEIEEACPNIVDLDLSNNLITTWEAIADIGRQLNKLKSLSLNDTRLLIPENSKQYSDAFTKLLHLFLCRTIYSWNDVLNLAEMWPHIETLKVPFCNIDVLETPQLVFHNLKHLDIQGNKIYKWSEICKLGHLPRLEILNACDTGITEIIIPPEERLFLKLHTLYISENYIKNCIDIIDLNNLPALKDLRINKNPLTTSDKFLSYREKIIARIGNLKVLNGREIMPDDRRSAEYDYLREFAKDWFCSRNDEKEKAKFLFENPRYPLLVQKYGPAEVPTEIDPSLKGHLITINLVHMTEDGAKQIIKKRVHLSLAVYKLIAIAKRAFNINTESPNLVRISSKNPAIKVEMSDQLKSMNIYAVEDGDTICINYEKPRRN